MTTLTRPGFAQQGAARRAGAEEKPTLTYQKPGVPQVVELVLAFEPRVKLEVCAGCDHTFPFVPNGDPIGLGAFQQRKSTASGL